jgi:hypothetical protein
VLRKEERRRKRYIKIFLGFSLALLPSSFAGTQEGDERERGGGGEDAGGADEEGEPLRGLQGGGGGR